MALYIVHSRAQALAATTVETLIQIVSASGSTCEVAGWGISFEGVTAANEPVLVDLLRQSTAGTPGATPTPVEWREGALAAGATAGTGFSAEPTAGDILHTEYIDPEGGYNVFYPPGERPVFVNGGRLGLRALANDNVNCTAWVLFDED